MNNRMIYTLKAPAKINIGLRIISKRKDGFHNIETIFYPIKLYDIVKLSIRKTPLRSQTGVWEQGLVNVTTDSPELKNDGKNICHKTVQLFFKKFRVTGKYKINIHIKKNIPIGAGLGGGSSDGAAVLGILYKHFKFSIHGMTQRVPAASLSSSQIGKLAEQLGSDVPYFTNYGLKPAYAERKGEKLAPLPEFKINYPILVVYPGIHVSTRWAYSKIKNQKSKIKKLKNIKQFIPDELKLFKNDFEEVVLKKYPVIKQIKDKMYECGALFSSMTGSGSAVYGIFEDLKGLEKCKRHFDRKRYKVYKV
jgi:4-diphosphocytidyl-2-C-methyl-D-erythritol kinase